MGCDRLERNAVTNIKRREAVRLLVAASGAAAFAWSPEEATRAHSALRTVRHASGGFEPRFFTPHEWATVRLLVDIIIPRDHRSGSATDAGVGEFMDFMMLDGDNEDRQTAMRGGLAWLDIECRERFAADFIDCSEEERRAVLDDIAWPAQARAELSHGVQFFNSFRNLTASGFWSSKMGVMDLQYMGNTALPEWTGCPDEQLRKLGLLGS